MLLVDSILLLSPSAQTNLPAEEKVTPQASRTLSGKTGRGKGRTALKSSGRSLDSRGRGKKGKGRVRSSHDGTSNSQVCFKCGSTDHWARDCPKVDDGSCNPKKHNLGAYAFGAWACNIPDNSRVVKSSNHFDDSVCLDFLHGAAISPAQDDDEREAHAAFLLESEGFGVLDCGATPLLGVLKVHRLCFPRVMNVIREFQILFHLVVDLSILEMVPRARPRYGPSSQSEMMLLANAGSLCICSLTNRNRLR